jgi:hypothetical protein
MRFTKAVLLLSALIGGRTTAEASAPIQLSRERFANSKAIDLDLEAQTQMAKGDLRAAEQSINEASDRSNIMANVLHACKAVRPTAQLRIGH